MSLQHAVLRRGWPSCARSGCTSCSQRTIARHACACGQVVLPASVCRTSSRRGVCFDDSSAFVNGSHSYADAGASSAMRGLRREVGGTLLGLSHRSWWGARRSSCLTCSVPHVMIPCRTSCCDKGGHGRRPVCPLAGIVLAPAADVWSGSCRRPRICVGGLVGGCSLSLFLLRVLLSCAFFSTVALNRGTQRARAVLPEPCGHPRRFQHVLGIDQNCSELDLIRPSTDAR